MAKNRERADGDEDVPGDAVAASFERLARLMRASEHAEGLNPAQWEALRYLCRANRFSNSPGALARYLGATKGTISQTVKSLEGKGFLAKAVRDGEKRSVTLLLTAKGDQAMTQDPWRRLALAADNLGGKTRRRLARGLRELLERKLNESRSRNFGQCVTCRFFREKGRDDDTRGPHLCMLFDAPVSAAEAQRICVEHEVSS